MTSLHKGEDKRFGLENRWMDNFVILVEQLQVMNEAENFSLANICAPRHC